MKIMTSKKAITILILAILSLNSLFAQKALSYEDALKMCMENNLGIKASQSNIKAKEQELKAQRGMYFPRISISAAYNIMSDEIEMDMNPIKESITPLYKGLSEYGNFSFGGESNPFVTTEARKKLKAGLQKIESADWTKVIQEKQFGSVNANLIFPIYAGGKIRAVNKAAQIYHEEAKNENEILKTELTSTLIERYFGLVLAREALNVREEAYQTIKMHMQNAEKMKNEGIIANAEFLHIKVFYSQADRELKKAQRTIEIAEEGLRNLLIDSMQNNIIPASSLFINDELPPLSTFIDDAANNSRLLKKVLLKKELVKTKHKVEVESFLPSVTLGGTYTLVGMDLGEAMPDYFVGIGLNWNIFDGTLRYKKVQSSKLTEQRVDLTYDKVKADLTTVITKLYNEAQMYIEEFQDLKTAKEFAQEYYRVRAEAFQQGFATSTEIADANLLKAKSRIDQLKAMYNYNKTLGKLLYYTGKTESFNEYKQSGHQ